MTKEADRTFWHSLLDIKPH